MSDLYKCSNNTGVTHPTALNDHLTTHKESFTYRKLKGPTERGCTEDRLTVNITGTSSEDLTSQNYS